MNKIMNAGTPLARGGVHSRFMRRSDDQFHQYYLEMKLAPGGTWKINNTPDCFA